MPQNIFKIYDGRNSFWQWDTDQKLIVLDATIDKVHFSNKYMRRAFTKDVYVDADGLRVCNIPDEMFTIPKNLIATAHDNEGVPDEIIRSVQFAVKARHIPYDYKPEQESKEPGIMQFNTLSAAEQWALDTKKAGSIIAVNIDSIWTACIIGEDYSVNTVWNQEYVLDAIDNLNYLVGDAKVQTVIENYNLETRKYVDRAIANIEIPEDYAKIEDIPTKVSQLQNDKGYLTEVPYGYATEKWVQEGYQPKGDYLTEHQDISGKLDASKLPEVINTALAQAKDSGEFDGYTPVKNVDYFDGQDYVLTDDDKNEIAEMAADLIYISDSENDVDLTGYATEEWVRESYQPKGEYLTEVPDGYAKTEDIPSVPTVVSAFENDAGYLTEHQDLSDYAKTEDIPTKPEDIGAQPAGNYLTTIPDGYATEEFVREGYQPKGNYLTSVPESYAKTSDIPTKPEDIGAQPAGDYLTEVPSGYATEEFVKNKIAEAALEGNDIDLSGYAQKSEIPTKVSQLDNDKGYLTEHQSLADYAKTEDIPTKPEDIGAQPAGNYLTTIPDGYATEEFVREGYQPKGNYLTSVPESYAKTSDIPTKPEDIGAQPAGDYLTEVPSGYATEEFVKNKIAEAALEGNDIDLSGYAQKSEIPTKVSQLDNDKGYLTEHQSLADYAKTEDIPTKPEDIGAQPVGNYALKTEIPSVPVQSVNGKTGAVQLSASDVGALPNTTEIPDTLSDLKDDATHRLTTDTEKAAWNAKVEISDIPTKVSQLTNDKGYLTEHQSLKGLATETYVNTQIAAIPTPDVSGQINTHNTATDSHNDIRLLIDGLTTRLNTLANSDDTTLDQMSEIVAYIKNNKALIEGVTTNKINVSDIINNLTTNVSNKPLSAAQGVALKALIDAIIVPTKVSELTNDSGFITGYTETDPTVPAWAKADTKPTYTASEVGALPSTTKIPSTLSDLSADSTHRTVTDAEKTAWNAKAETSAIPTKVSQLTNDSKFLTSFTETDPTVPSWAKADSKPSYSKSEVGLGNVDNVKQYSASNPPPYPVTSVNGKTGAVTIDIPSVPSWAMTTSKPSYSKSEVGLGNVDNVKQYSASNPPVVVQTSAPTDTSVIWVDPNDNYVDEFQDAVPSYWQTALDEGAKAINTALCTAGRNKSAFLFYSDAHWNYGSQMSPTLLKYLYRNTGMTKTFFGGDIVNDESTDYDTMKYLWEWRKQLKDLPNHHSVVGNHDDGGDTDVQFTEQYVYGYMLAAEETNDIVRCDSGLYYYVDSPGEKTRYLCLDTGFKDMSSLSTEQAMFISETLKSTPNGWHIVVVAHIWYEVDYDQYNTRPIPIKGLTATASSVLTILDKYNGRSGEFADCGAWVEFCVGGHIHYDYDAVSSTGIPIVLVETDSWHTRGNYNYSAGTTTEASVNGIIADYTNHKIYVVRIGRGGSREIAVTNYVVEYNNVLDDEGVGYKKDVRWSSSGNSETTSNATGLYLTGFIPVSKGDVIYLKNVTMNKANAGSNGCAIHHFETKTSTDEGTRSGDTITNYMDGIWDENGNLVRFTVKEDNEKFIRLQGTYFGPDSIVTINEPIE